MLIEAPYFDDPTAVFTRLAPLGHPVLLDSGGDDERGRWDIIAAAPDPERSLCLDASAARTVTETQLQRWLSAIAEVTAPRETQAVELPFRGGYIGHFSYELGRRLLQLPPSATATLPLACVHYYPWAILQDRRQARSWLVGDLPGGEAEAAEILDLLRRQAPEPGAFCTQSSFEGLWSPAAYARVFDRVKHYIEAGDCYQINIGQPFIADFGGDLLRAYRALRRIARAPCSAFLPLHDGNTLLCLSPERFLTVDRGRVETRPIKGTRPRSPEPGADRAAAQALLQSDKERAENLMIVDLLRNDIGRFCKAGSVNVDALFQLESYATVHHLVSVVSGQLLDAVTPLQLLLGCLPGGSITGAPKQRAMQIIDELEPAPRQAWCGTIFYLSNHGRLDSNITIRTLYSEGSRLHCWAGGGLVHDSEAGAEFQEQRDKVGAFLDALERYPRCS